MLALHVWWEPRRQGGQGWQTQVFLEIIIMNEQINNHRQMNQSFDFPLDWVTSGVSTWCGWRRKILRGLPGKWSELPGIYLDKLPGTLRNCQETGQNCQVP